MGNSYNCGLNMAMISCDMIISRETGQLLLMIPIYIYLYIYSLCMGAAMALVNVHICTGSIEP